MQITDWTIPGADALPIHANTHLPDAVPRAVAVIVHGWTGCKDRNIIPVLAQHAASIGCIAHRFSFGHCGIEKDADIITRHDEFSRDALAYQFEDLRRVIDAINNGSISGKGLPLVLIGHSRGGATVLGASARAHQQQWSIKPAATIAVAAPSAYTRLTDEVRRELAANGFVEKKVTRAEGGIVRMVPSWYAHYTDNPNRDLFAEDMHAARGPILLIHGDADDAVPTTHPHQIMELLRNNPNCEPELAMIRWGDHNLGAIGFGVDHKRSQKPAILEGLQAIESFLDRNLPPSTVS